MYILGLFVLICRLLLVDSKSVYNETQINYDNRIIDGKPAAVGQFPWQVAIYRLSALGLVYHCGGSLISANYVLTAAHCTFLQLFLQIYLGGITLDPKEEGKISCVSSTFIDHPDFSFFGIRNDIALILLPQAVELSDRIKPVALVDSGSVLDEGVPVTVSGFGRTSDDNPNPSPILNYVELTTITNEECAEEYGDEFIHPYMVCARGNPHHSSCHGDSGGPLVILDNNGVATHVGIVSFGHGAGCEIGKPSGYTRTASFREWIRENSGV